MPVNIGITERGDAALSDDWVDWVYNKDLPAILITKNVIALENKHPDIFTKNVIVHITCTGLGGTILEPNVPDYKSILQWIQNQPATIKRKIVLRCDPLCPTLFEINNEKFDGNKYGNAIREIFTVIEQEKLRCRISFLDMYNHVRSRFEKLGIPVSNKYSNIEYNSIHLPLKYRQEFLEVLKMIAPTTFIEICGEPGLTCTGCLSKLDLDILGMEPMDLSKGQQRLACQCLGIKKELLNNKHPCAHNCAYCYWKD